MKRQSRISLNKFLEKATFAVLSISSMAFLSQESWANILVSTSSTSQQSFSWDNPLITISSTGNLQVAGAAAIRSAEDGATGLSVVVDATGTNGIRATGGTNGAIEITGTDIISSVWLNSGVISSDKISGGTISLKAGGSGYGLMTANIYVANGASLTNSVNSGFAIESDTLPRTILRVNVATGGTVSATDNANSAVIAFGANNGFSALQVLNDGTMSAGANGYVVKMKQTASGNNTATITNSANGVMTGNFDFTGNNLSRITNRGTIIGNISGSTTQKAIVTSNAGSITGNITLGSSNISLVEFNGGTVTGNIMMGNAAQTTTFRGGAFIGKLDGTGQVIIDTAAQTLAGNIGSITPVLSLTVNAGNSLNTSSSSVSATNIALLNGSTLTTGGGAITGNIAINSSTLNLNNNTVIAGNITSNVATINLGDSSHVQTGTLTLLAGDNLATRISSATLAGNITSTSAAINANTNFAVTTGNIVNPGSYNIVRGVVDATISAIDDTKINVNGTNSNRIGLLTYSTTSSDNTLILHVARDNVTGIGGDDSQQGALSAVLDSTNPVFTGELLTLQNYLVATNNVTNEQRQEALQSVGANNTGLNKAAFDSTNISINTSERRLEMARDMKRINSDKISPFYKFMSRKKDDIAKDNAPISYASLKSKSTIDYMNDDYEEEKEGDFVNEPNNKGLWIQAFGTSAKQDNKKGFYGYNSLSAGIAFGADAKTDKDTTVGASFSIANSRVKASDSLKSTNIDSYQLNIYGGKTFDKYFVDLLAGITLNQYSSDRRIPLVTETAKAKYNGETYLAKVKAGFVEQIGGNFELIPETSLTYARNSVADYTESGAGTLNLHVKNRDANFLEGAVGLGIGYNSLSYKKVHVYPKVTLSYGYDFIGNKQTATSNFVGQNVVFDTQSSKINRNSFKMDAGLDIYAREDISIRANYILERKVTYQSHSGILKAIFLF